MLVTQIYIFFNPCAGVTHRHLSDHMSDMVENTLNDLQQSKVQCYSFITTFSEVYNTPIQPIVWRRLLQF